MSVRLRMVVPGAALLVLAGGSTAPVPGPVLRPASDATSAAVICVFDTGHRPDDPPWLTTFSPIGLDLGARTPAETAVSIAAEIIAIRWGGGGQRLADQPGDTPRHPWLAVVPQLRLG